MSRKVNILGAFIAFIAVNNIIAFSFNLGAPYYVIMGGSLLFALLQSKVLSFDVPMLLLYLACALSIIGNPVPGIFSAVGTSCQFYNDDHVDFPIYKIRIFIPFSGSYI